jgi:hypothetical protein
MGKRLALVAIRLLVSVNLLYAAVFAKFAGVPQSVALFTQMSQAVHGLISQLVFRLGSGVFETMVGVLFLIPKSQIGGETGHFVDDRHYSQSHFRVGIWMVLCRCSRVDAAGCQLSLADSQAQQCTGRSLVKVGGTYVARAIRQYRTKPLKSGGRRRDWMASTPRG